MTDLKRDSARYPNRVIKFTIDLPPSKNHAFVYRNFEKVPKTTTNEYVNRLKSMLTNVMKRKKKELPYVWYYLDLFFYFPDKKIRDSHNMLEVMMDGLEGDLIPNDYFVLPRIQSVKLDREDPRVVCYLRPIDSAPKETEKKLNKKVKTEGRM